MALLPSGNEAGEAAERLIGIAKMLRIELSNWSARCDAGSLDAYVFLDDFLWHRLKAQSRAVWPTYAAVSGVQAVIRQRIPGVFADDAAVTTQLTAIQDEMDSLITYIETNVQNALISNGWIQVLSLGTDTYVHRAITNGTQLANLKTELQALRAELTA